MVLSFLTPELHKYLEAVGYRESAVLQALRRETATLPHAEMQISPDEGQLLAMLAELIGAKKTIDIGTFTGYSALVVASVLPQDGHMIACDVNEQTSEIAKAYWQKAGLDKKIELRLAPALETLTKLTAKECETFDFIFIDADKQNYDNYYELAFRLLRTGGLIAIDNTLWDGKVIDRYSQDPSTVEIRRLNQKIYNDKRVSMLLLPIRDGVTIVRKK